MNRCIDRQINRSMSGCMYAAGDHHNAILQHWTSVFIFQLQDSTLVHLGVSQGDKDQQEEKKESEVSAHDAFPPSFVLQELITCCRPNFQALNERKRLLYLP